MPAHPLNYAIFLLLMVFIVWRRIGRQFGRQPIRRKRMLMRVAVFALVGALLALGGLHNVRLLAGLLGGVVLGGTIGLLGLRLTRFVNDPVRGDCYIPHPWIGALLTVVLLARLAWRLPLLLAQMQHAELAESAHAPAIGSSPLTLLVFGLLVGYYIAFYSGLLVHHRRFQQGATRLPEGG